MKRSLSVLGLALLTALSIGCGGGDNKAAKGGGKQDPDAAKLVGAWEGKETPTVTVDGKKIEAKGDPIPIHFEFRADGAMIMKMPFADLPLNGTWKLVKSEGNKLTIQTVMNMPSLSFEDKTEKDKTTSKTEVTTKKEEDTFTIVFETPDRIAMTPTKDPSDTLKLERKK